MNICSPDVVNTEVQMLECHGVEAPHSGSTWFTFYEQSISAAFSPSIFYIRLHLAKWINEKRLESEIFRRMVFFNKLDLFALTFIHCKKDSYVKRISGILWLSPVVRFYCTNKTKSIIAKIICNNSHAHEFVRAERNAGQIEGLRHLKWLDRWSRNSKWRVVMVIKIFRNCLKWELSVHE